MGAVSKLADATCSTIIEELGDMSYKELQRMNRGLNATQNIISDLMADKVLGEETAAAYRRGREDFLAGVPSDENPYLSTVKPYDAWDSGWHDEYDGEEA